MNGQVRQKRKRMGHRRNAAALRGLGHVEGLDRLALMIAQKRELGAQTGSERVIDLRWVNADDGELAVVDLQFFLKFDVVAQLHLAFPSPVAAVKCQDKRK